MKLKLDEQGHVVLSDGKPVYIHDDGKEVPFDAAGTVATISRLNAEAKGHREAKEAAEANLKAFEGLDPSKARDALDKLGKIDAKALIDAGEVDRLKAEISASYKAQIDELSGKLKSSDDRIYDLTVGSAFKGSKFIGDKVAVPPHLLQATYGKNFKVEGDKIVPYDAAGNKIYSRARPGEVADFDEGIELLISSDPYRDAILKGTGNSGGGAVPGSGPGGGSKTITRADFDRMPAGDRAAKIKDGFSVVDGN